MPRSPVIRLGAVGYLNARPHVFGLDRSPRFAVRFDVPSRCAELLHEDAVDAGLIPSIEYLRAPAGVQYWIVPDIAIASRGPVASVAIFTKRPIGDVRTLALDTSSRASVALARVLCARVFHIAPAFEPRGPDLEAMLARSDAALVIGDNALFVAARHGGLKADSTSGENGDCASVGSSEHHYEKIDLGEVWTRTTGLPFVYAFWAGRAGALTPGDVAALQAARDGGVQRPEQLAAAYLGGSPERQAVGARYLRDNIKYHLGQEERAGLELFYRYAHEAGVVDRLEPLRFYAGVDRPVPASAD
jgi:chorismate dehydratase